MIGEQRADNPCPRQQERQHGELATMQDSIPTPSPPFFTPPPPCIKYLQHASMYGIYNNAPSLRSQDFQRANLLRAMGHADGAAKPGDDFSNTLYFRRHNSLMINTVAAFGIIFQLLYGQCPPKKGAEICTSLTLILLPREDATSHTQGTVKARSNKPAPAGRVHLWACIYTVGGGWFGFNFVRCICPSFFFIRRVTNAGVTNTRPIMPAGKPDFQVVIFIWRTITGSRDGQEISSFFRFMPNILSTTAISIFTVGTSITNALLIGRPREIGLPCVMCFVSHSDLEKCRQRLERTPGNTCEKLP